MKRDIGFILLLIILLFGLGAFFFLAPTAPELAYVPVDVGGGSITVVDQDQLAFVKLNAELAAPGFITIHESLSGAPANILGTSTYFEAGTYTDLVIDLETPMTPGFVYITLLHADNGDGAYVTEDDLPVKVNEQVVRPDFVAMPEVATNPDPTE